MALPELELTWIDNEVLALIGAAAGAVVAGAVAAIRGSKQTTVPSDADNNTAVIVSNVLHVKLRVDDMNHKLNELTNMVHEIKGRLD